MYTQYRTIMPDTVDRCWYARSHVPDGKRYRAEDGSLQCRCRHCGKRIRHSEAGDWRLAEGLDLDALQEHSATGHFCVVDMAAGMVLARYPIAMDADEAWIVERLAEIADEFGIDESDPSLRIRVVPGNRQSRSAH